MSAVREVLFDVLVNASVQVALFALLAAALSSLVARAKAKHQHLFYLGVLVLCFSSPVMNTFGGARRAETAQSSSRDVVHDEQVRGRGFWIWQGGGRAARRFEPGAEIEGAVLALWGAVSLWQLVRFSMGLRRARRLRREARPLSSREIGLAGGVLSSRGIALLQSAEIDDPVTVGVLHPAIVLPSRLVPLLGDDEFSAVFAHEYAHICRRDFLSHVACEAARVPVAWHPGIRYVMSRISQTRELACDEDAVVRLGRRSGYARTLLRLASLCLDASRGSAVGLGIFDGDNLEDRIMKLTKKRSSLSRASLAGLVLAIGVSFGSGALLARATSLEIKTYSPNKTQAFAGTWHWMFQGKAFSTMILIPEGSGFSGSSTESRIALDDQGYLSKADASEGVAPSPITSAVMEGTSLHVRVKDGFEFLVTLKDATHAEIHPIGAPANMKAILAEKVQ